MQAAASSAISRSNTRDWPGYVPVMILDETAISHMLGLLDAFQLRPFTPPSPGPHVALRR